MKEIMLVTGNPHIIATCKTVLAGKDFADIRLIPCDAMSDQQEILETIVARGAEVIIARGAKALSIAAKLPVTVVELPATAFDLLRALEKAKTYGGLIGLIGAGSLIHGARHVAELLDVEIRPYPLAWQDDARALMDQAVRDGVDVIVGGHSQLLGVGPVDCPVVTIGVDVEAILQAIDEARKIASAIEMKKRQNTLMQAFLAHASDGVIAVNDQSVVFMFNPSAQRLLYISEKKALGKALDDLCPELSLQNVLQSGQDELGSIVTHGQATLICNKVVVRVDGKIVGALATFQDTTKIQQLESNVRRRIFETGHMANGTFDVVLGKSAAISHAVSTAKEYSLTNSSILILGETGTGKELFAQSVHNYSRRSKGPFVAINCAALPPELLESELFGYEPGAFTGASAKGKPGMFELAHGGTLFLDEIGEMDMNIQSKFLRALQERKIIRLGSVRVIPVDVRLITATNRNLYKRIAEGVFRKDLYYRLNVLQLSLPSLREYVEDIPLLVKSFLARHLDGTKRKPHLTAKAIKALQSHSWPGNVRELSNVMERLAAMHGGKEIIDDSLIGSVFDKEVSPPSPPARDALEDDLMEIYRVLANVRGNYTQAARMLGISRVTLWRKLKGGRPLQAESADAMAL